MLPDGLTIERSVTSTPVTFALVGELDIDAVGNVERRHRRSRVLATNDLVDRAFALAGSQLGADIDSCTLFVPTRRSSRVPVLQRAPQPGHDSHPARVAAIPDTPAL